MPFSYIFVFFFIQEGKKAMSLLEESCMKSGCFEFEKMLFY